MIIWRAHTDCKTANGGGEATTWCPTYEDAKAVAWQMDRWDGRHGAYKARVDKLKVDWACSPRSSLCEILNLLSDGCHSKTYYRGSNE